MRAHIPHFGPALDTELPDGRRVVIEHPPWPELNYLSYEPAEAAVKIIEVTRGQANQYLTGWKHPLGPYRRPFGQQHFLMLAGRHNRPVAVASSGSVRRPTVAGGLRRDEVVELARIARSPEHPRSLRAMLRLWTDYLAVMWTDKYPDWELKAAISYALPGKAGNLYRFDGWEPLGETEPWGGSTGWGKQSAANGIGDGKKKVWLYRYDQ